MWDIGRLVCFVLVHIAIKHVATLMKDLWSPVVIDALFTTPATLVLLSYAVSVQHRILWAVADAIAILAWVAIVAFGMGNMGNMMIGLDMLFAAIIRHTSPPTSVQRALVVFWASAVLFHITHGAENTFEAIFVPRMDSALTGLQISGLIVYYFGLCADKDRSLLHRFAGALCVAAL